MMAINCRCPSYLLIQKSHLRWTDEATKYPSSTCHMCDSAQHIVSIRSVMFQWILKGTCRFWNNICCHLDILFITTGHEDNFCCLLTMWHHQVQVVNLLVHINQEWDNSNSTCKSFSNQFPLFQIFYEF